MNLDHKKTPPRMRQWLRFSCAFVLASTTAGILAGIVFGDKLHGRENHDQVGGFGAIALLIFVPFWLFVFSLPRRIRARIEAKRTAEAVHERNQIAEDESRTQQRRKDARARCELLFNLYIPDMAGRFNRAMFDSFMNAYMSDAEPPDVVERRTEELCGIMEKHREAVKGSAKPASIDQLATWFLDEKKRIELLPLDDDIKDEHLAHLNIRYSELSQEILEKMKP